MSHEEKREELAEVIHYGLRRDDYGVANEDERDEVLTVADAVIESGLFPSHEELEAQVAELQSLISAVFGALDGEGINYQYGEFKNGEPATIGGIQSFTADWNGDKIPSWRGERWEDLTTEQKFESSKFSAQHALINRLGDLRRKYNEQKND